MQSSRRLLLVLSAALVAVAGCWVDVEYQGCPLNIKLMDLDRSAGHQVRVTVERDGELQSHDVPMTEIPGTDHLNLGHTQPDLDAVVAQVLLGQQCRQRGQTDRPFKNGRCATLVYLWLESPCDGTPSDAGPGDAGSDDIE